MSESKQPHLNQPYYGPTIPPSQPSSLNPPNFPNLYSLLCTLTKLTTILLITIGITILILWLIYHPQTIKVFAESASLSTFNLSLFHNTSFLTYDLSINFSFRNPNSKYSVYYQRVTAQAMYGGDRIGAIELAHVRQRRKSTMMMPARFGGRVETMRGEGFERDKKEGFFNVGVRIYAIVRLKMIVVQSVEFKPDVECELRIPAVGNGTSVAVGFVGTECEVRNFS